MTGRARTGLVVFAVALLVRCIVVLALGLAAPPVAWGDDADYDAIARGLAGAHGYVNTWYPPGYPFLLALIYAAAGPSPAAARLLQAVLSAATCWVVYVIARDAFGRSTATVAGLLLAVLPAHAYMAWRLMAETPFILLLALAVACAQQAVAAGSPRLAALAGAALGASLLFKSNLALAVPLLLLWAAWAAVNTEPRRRGAILAAGVAGCALLVALLPAASALSPSRSAELLPGNGGPTLWWSNNPLADGYFVDPDGTAAGRAFIERHGLASAALQSRDPLLRSRADRELAWDWVRENPGAFLALAGRKLWNAFGPTPRTEVFGRQRPAAWLYTAGYAVLLPLIVLGAWRTRRQWRAALPLYLLLAGSVAMTVICYGTPRFTLLVVPFLLILAGAAVAETAPARHPAAAPAALPLPGESA